MPYNGHCSDLSLCPSDAIRFVVGAPDRPFRLFCADEQQARTVAPFMAGYVGQAVTVRSDSMPYVIGHYEPVPVDPIEGATEMPAGYTVRVVDAGWPGYQLWWDGDPDEPMDEYAGGEQTAIEMAWLHHYFMQVVAPANAPVQLELLPI